jgi:hypothetical protein
LSGRLLPWRVAVLGTLLALLWQWLLVAGFFQGHWSALFYAGSRFEQSPPVRAEGSYVLPNNTGYDGQFYHAMAHDPLELHGTERFIDAPHMRYSRILLSGLSYVFGLGRLFWVDRAYRALELLSVFIGILCIGGLAQSWGRTEWWGLAFLALPAVFISLERQLTDLPLCALIAAAFAAAKRGSRTASWGALAAAGLAREMGLVAVGAFVLPALRQRRFRAAASWAGAALPALAWNAYVFWGVPQAQATRLGLTYPLASVVWAIRHLQTYPFAPRVIDALHVLDVIAIAGALLAFAWGFWAWARERDELAAAAGLLALFGLVVSASPALDYTDVYSFGRQNGPLLMILMLLALRSRRWSLLLPLLLILPRAVLPDAALTFRAARHLLFGV